MKITRDEAYKTLTKNMKKDSLLKHSLAVEAVMRHFAEIEKEDVEYWGIAGLLHDVDFELYPDEHCHKYREVLAEELKCEMVDDKLICSLETHGHELVKGMPEPKTKMEKILITIDQLTGFITACALMKPSKKLAEVELPSMKKKWKKKDFAKSTERERIEFWTKELEKDLDYMLEETLKGMKKISADLGL